LLGWLFVYLAILFGMATGFRWRGWSRAVLNCLPSGLMAATTMSSDATLPVTLAGAEKNLHDPEIARLLIPATVNIQMPGDCFINIFLAFSLIPLFGLTHPAPMQLIAFWFSFVLARFAAVGVTGGAIWLMIPLYEQYLGFTPAMTSLMISFNLLLDPIVTSSNVMGNGALAMLFERLLGHRVLSSGKPLVAR
ncbi:MAG: cation:dicarboxylate symporter family transporter, partial [Chlamydiia bacterium]